jgi:exodeoxyribonuclease VII small subunit
MAKPKPIPELTYEQALSELEDIVAALEAGQSSLDESINLFQRGQELARHCASLLDQAELKIQQLTNGTLARFEPQES